MTTWATNFFSEISVDTAGDPLSFGSRISNDLFWDCEAHTSSGCDCVQLSLCHNVDPFLCCGPTPLFSNFGCNCVSVVPLAWQRKSLSINLMFCHNTLFFHPGGLLEYVVCTPVCKSNFDLILFWSTLVLVFIMPMVMMEMPNPKEY